MTSKSDDNDQGARYFGSNTYNPDLSSESKEEPQHMEDQKAQQQPNRHKLRLINELRYLIF